MKHEWVDGNRVLLLENGEAFFPAVFDAISKAREQVLIDTFILFDDPVGRELRQVSMDAAHRGVKVEITVDGWGSADLSESFCADMVAAGVCLHVYDPVRRIYKWRTRLLRRMHRKLVVIDGAMAFVGGINFGEDHLVRFGPMAKQDYAVRIEGPVVRQIQAYAQQTGVLRRQLAPPRLSGKLARRGDAAVMFVVRDNRRHRTDIERHYRAAIRLARNRVIIANAYFFPGYRLLREIRMAARRGVRVVLLLQGEPDMPAVRFASQLLYDQLVAAGVELHEYTERPLHAKVAVIDDEWATVGSSNMDPLSLALNLEANVMIRDREFNTVLASRLTALIEEHGRRISARHVDEPGYLASVRSAFLYHLMRRFPTWGRVLPTPAPTVESRLPGGRDPLRHRP